MRRAIPLWRTDYRCEPIGTQCCSYGISLWIPLSGTGAADVDPYIFRSNMVPFTNCLFDIRNKKLDYDLLRRLVAQWRKVADCYLGDFYPLTAVQHRQGRLDGLAVRPPGDGRRDGAGVPPREVHLRGRPAEAAGLDPTPATKSSTSTAASRDKPPGQELMEKGLLVTIPDQPGAVVLSYRRVK